MECPSCSQVMPIASLLSQLLCSIRGCIATFNEAWMVCDDTTCGCRTRQIGVLGRKCPVSGCRGFLSLEVSAKAMLRQLMYYSQIVDLESFVEKNGADGEEKKKIVEEYEGEFRVLKKSVEGYLEKNSCRTVDLKKFFVFMGIEV
jgi:DNA polymerase alpha subunit A